MVRKLSLGSWRRWSKANRDGSLRENMAKADIKASPRGIAGSSDRGSGTSSQRARTRRKRASAERCLRAFLAERPMACNSCCPKVKKGKPGKYFVSWLYERQGQNRQPVPKNSTGRELLVNAEGLRRYLTETSDRQLAALQPKDAASLEEFRRVLGSAVRA